MLKPGGVLYGERDQQTPHKHTLILWKICKKTQTTVIYDSEDEDDAPLVHLS